MKETSLMDVGQSSNNAEDNKLNFLFIEVLLILSPFFDQIMQISL